jgi:hypothetical protein
MDATNQDTPDPQDDSGSRSPICSQPHDCELVSVDFVEHTVTVKMPLSMSAHIWRGGVVKCDFSAVTEKMQ